MKINILAHFAIGTLTIQSGFPLAKKWTAIAPDIENISSRDSMVNNASKRKIMNAARNQSKKFQPWLEMPHNNNMKRH